MQAVRTLIFRGVVRLLSLFHLSNLVTQPPDRALSAVRLAVHREPILVSSFKNRFLCGFVQSSPTSILAFLRFLCLRRPSPTRFDYWNM